MYFLSRDEFPEGSEKYRARRSGTVRRSRSFQPHELRALEDMADYIEQKNGDKEDEEWALKAMQYFKINRKQTFGTRTRQSQKN